MNGATVTLAERMKLRYVRSMDEASQHVEQIGLKIVRVMHALKSAWTYPDSKREEISKHWSRALIEDCDYS